MYTSIAHCQLPLPPAVHMTAPAPSRSRMTTDSSSSRTIVASHAGSTRWPAGTTTTMSYGDSLPPYSLDTELPRYTRVPEIVVTFPEPPTITMYLFWSGFLFPLLWIFGAFTLKYTCYRSSCSVNSDSSSEKAEDTRHNFVYRRRETEIKWARRCIWASTIMLCITIALGISVWGALNSRDLDRGTD
ncbi:hypothetical protein BDZ94DRAFT_1247364 [Collybia nuda]|uniref:Transmembrane protein n=1 Tax=Collybia nuda TaxID=64659 RepID=A0A9P6CIZ2_9AGAR|nr:hypothetical protein BDZ94DRAFT_1247364 [Collybia nuda]